MTIQKVHACVFTGLAVYICAREYEKNENKKKIEAIIRRGRQHDLHDVYDLELRSLAIQSIKICRVWSKTDCQTARDIVPFLEKYARIKAEQDDVKGVKTSSAKELVDFNIIKNFHREGITFWHDAAQDREPLDLSFYPNLNEIKTCLTIIKGFIKEKTGKDDNDHLKMNPLEFR